MISIKFGARNFLWDPNLGFFINDQNLKVIFISSKLFFFSVLFFEILFWGQLKGVCNHQDFAGCGVAVPDRINRFFFSFSFFLSHPYPFHLILSSFSPNEDIEWSHLQKWEQIVGECHTIHQIQNC